MSITSDMHSGQVVHPNDKKELNYENMEEEHRRLLGVIREATSETRTEPSERLVLRVQVPSSLNDRGRRDEGWQHCQITAKLFVSLTGGEAVGEVTVSVAAPKPFTVREPTITLSGIRGGGTPRAVPLTFGLSSGSMVTDLEVAITAHYTTPRGEPRSCTASISLPLTMCGRSVPPVKTADFKYTLDTNRGAPPLWAIFEDLLPPEERGAGENASNVVSFQFHSGGEATILVSKNSGRYRVQGGSMESTWLLGSELARRLNLHFQHTAGGPEEPFEISCSDELPLPEYFAVIDMHHEIRKYGTRCDQRIREAS